MEFKKISIDGAYIIEPRVFNDARGCAFSPVSIAIGR
jgi:dTDP-4-dehydrorhamnose 3,5-epimerase-like enzyme